VACRIDFNRTSRSNQTPVTFGCGPSAVSKGKGQSVPERACLEQRRRVGTRAPHTGLPSIDRELSDCLPMRAPSPGPKSCSLRGELHCGPKVLCGSCCDVVTDTQRVAVQTPHLPSSGSGLAEASRPSFNGLSTLGYHSLIDPNRPQRTEFIRMRKPHLEPLRRDHIRTKLPVRPSTQLAQLPTIALAARPAGTRRNNRNRTVGKRSFP